MPDDIRLHAWIHGFVQGVSFRYYTIREAQGLGVVGWVRNRWDGSVEVVAEGQPEAVSNLLSWLRRGPPAAEVDRVDVQWEEPTGECGRFEVRF
jgi:acylphosphatase